MNIKKFYKEVMAEMKNVKWPTKRMVMYSTLTVIVLSIVIASYLGGVDFGLQKLLVKITG